MKVRYLEANDINGRYRWWTPSMGEVGQFEHASSLEEIEQKARTIEPIVLIDVEDEEEEKPPFKPSGSSFPAKPKRGRPKKGST